MQKGKAATERQGKKANKMMVLVLLGKKLRNWPSAQTGKQQPCAHCQKKQCAQPEGQSNQALNQLAHSVIFSKFS
ncbi:hypothetical protein [Pseudomonas fragi]|uniref:hypothetical protein n=1 Tax=Pseudomonas fragi TaxID=296 RepID=UPI0012EBDBC5|nr:hypothetical protein [Pseudomonas fragi]